MLGLAMYNMISVEPIFANFFLKMLLGQRNYFDDIEDVDIFMEIQRQRIGGHIDSVPLQPNGANIRVKKENILQYVVKVADYILNKEFAPQCRAFLRGLRMLIPEQLLKIFSPNELQTLISGSDKPLDVSDLKRNCNIVSTGFT